MIAVFLFVFSFSKYSEKGQGSFLRYWLEQTNAFDGSEPDSSSKGARVARRALALGYLPRWL